MKRCRLKDLKLIKIFEKRIIILVYLVNLRENFREKISIIRNLMLLIKFINFLNPRKLVNWVL